MNGYALPTDLTVLEIYKYEVISELFESNSSDDKVRQTQEMTTWIRNKSIQIVDANAGVSSRRIWVTMPDLVAVNTIFGERVVEGYYLNAVLAGLKSSLPPQQPVSEYPIPFVRRLYHSTDYFNNVQIRTMESAGCMFFYQPSEGSVPRARRQISTDTSSIKTMEISTVTVVDTIAKQIRAGLCLLTGRNLITPNLINVVRVTIESYIAQAKDAGMISGGSVTKLEIDANAPDHLIINLQLATYDPFNAADIHLYI
jgi:hypothetical protein